MNNTDGMGLYEAMAKGIMELCVQSSQSAVSEVVQENHRRLPMTEADEIATAVHFHSSHSGAAPDRLDVVAKNIATKIWLAGLSDLLGPGYQLPLFAGEEAGAPTQEISIGQLIIRQDSLDGTTNCLSRIDDFASVQLVDQVRSLDAGNPRVRHIAGAITTSSGHTVSWTNLSTYDREAGRYRRLAGDVFTENKFFGIARQHVVASKWRRTAGTVAAVAAGKKRRIKLQDKLAAMGLEPEVLYTTAGNPLVQALVAGDIFLVIEPNPVSLHDSALLIPHQLLGGAITDLELRPINYLGLYEASGLDLSPDARPISEYAAWGSTPKAA